VPRHTIQRPAIPLRSSALLTMAARIQFVNIDDPLRTASANKQQRQAAYAHAARAGHTKRRKRQQKSTRTAITPCQDNNSSSDSSVPPANEVASHVTPTRYYTNDASQDRPIPGEETALIHSWRNSSLGSLVMAKDRDPFQCFARSFSPMELYLLDHCKKTSTTYFA
jgi:hypothetical protein